MMRAKFGFRASSFKAAQIQAARVFSCGYATQCSIEVNGVVSAAANPAC